MKLKAGTRGSEMALSQAGHVVDALQAAHSDLDIELTVIKTGGDKKQGTAQAAVKDKKEWIDEIEQAVFRGDVDFAIHSGKDVPIDIDPSTGLIPVLKRSNPFDVYIPKTGSEIDIVKDLGAEGQIGTASFRRRSQLLCINKEITVVPHRGNAPTRIKKLEESETLSGIVLAKCGLDRLGLNPKQKVFSAEEMLPAMNQGILVAQYSKTRPDIEGLLEAVVDPDTYIEWAAERALIAELGADCHSAVAAFALPNGDGFKLSCRVLSPNGSECLESSIEFLREEAVEKAKQLGREMLDNGAGRLLDICREASEKRAGL